MFDALGGVGNSILLQSLSREGWNLCEHVDLDCPCVITAIALIPCVGQLQRQRVLALHDSIHNLSNAMAHIEARSASPASAGKVKPACCHHKEGGSDMRSND